MKSNFDKEFKEAIRQFYIYLVRDEEKYKEGHYFKHLNRIIIKAVGTEDIQEQTLLNEKEYAYAVLMRKFIICEIQVQIKLNTEYHEAFENIKSKIEDKFKEFTSV